MKLLRWSIVDYDAGDFVPIIVGTVIFVLSLPTFILLLLNADRGAFGLTVPLLVLFGACSVGGLAFLGFGIRLCSSPGSMAYRLTHGSAFGRRNIR